jgi:D-2-hydroxyacid dehydrogenase (NADP+)
LKIYIDKKMMGRDNYPKILAEFKEVDFLDSLEEKAEIEALIIMNSTLKKLNISEFPKLKWIQLLMAGFDNVDVLGYKNKGILVSNARDIFSISIAEDVISKILMFNRNTKYYLESMNNQTWEPISKEPEIFNSTITILGTGSIGQEVAKRLKAFDVKKIYGYKQTLESVPYFDEIVNDETGLEEIIRISDYLILALPLNSKTYHLINKNKLKLMKKNSLLINVARGEIIDQDALVEVLKNKMIRGAGLDVTTPEPLPHNHDLWKLDNVFITPHNASSSPYMKERLYEMTRDNIKLFVTGKEIKYLL